MIQASGMDEIEDQERLGICFEDEEIKSKSKKIRNQLKTRNIIQNLIRS